MGAVGCRVMSVSGRKSNPRPSKNLKICKKSEKFAKNVMGRAWDSNSWPSDPKSGLLPLDYCDHTKYKVKCTKCDTFAN